MIRRPRTFLEGIPLMMHRDAQPRHAVASGQEEPGAAAAGRATLGSSRHRRATAALLAALVLLPLGGAACQQGDGPSPAEQQSATAAPADPGSPQQVPAASGAADALATGDVSAVDPAASMQAIDNPMLAEVATEVQAKLKRVIDGL